jgi:site-specific DNA-methyltransferase (adenine-specific)
MKAYYEENGITIYHGDNREIIPSLTGVDVVITDPPYGAKTHKGARSMKDLVKSQIDFAPITDDEFVDMCGTLVGLAQRWVVMTCEWRHAVRLEDMGLLVRLGVWIKPNGAPQFTGDRPGTGWEAVAVMHRPGKKRWNGGGHHAVWNFPTVRGQHPTEKPIKLIQKWVQDFSEEGECVLDPYMGSGTTLAAARSFGRNAIGIEIDERYCEIAAKRLQQQVLGF